MKSKRNTQRWELRKIIILSIFILFIEFFITLLVEPTLVPSFSITLDGGGGNPLSFHSPGNCPFTYSLCIVFIIQYSSFTKLISKVYYVVFNVFGEITRILNCKKNAE